MGQGPRTNGVSTSQRELIDAELHTVIGTGRHPRVIACHYTLEASGSGDDSLYRREYKELHVVLVFGRGIGRIAMGGTRRMVGRLSFMS